MQAGELKPILSALVLPPAGPLLLALLGALLAWGHRRTGIVLVLVGVTALWGLSCNAVAVLLARHALPQHAPVTAQQLQTVQALVVLGGGMLAASPEYGSAQPNSATLRRLRYAARLARQSDKPVGFAGGVGWSSAGSSIAPEAQAAAEVLADAGVRLRWSDARSRDTAENAGEMRKLLAPDGVRRIALVTDAWHMPRAVLEFQRAGFDVVPAPTGFAAAETRRLLTWLPSAEGLTASRHVLRELLALQAAALGPGKSQALAPS